MAGNQYISVDGVRIRYRSAGSGPALILVHGLVGSADNWRWNIDSWAQNATVYSVDLANMGLSDRVLGLDAGQAATADRLAALMDALGIPDADIAGHSHGGAIAMMLAARHPERVRRLVLFAPANPFCDAGRQLIKFYRTRVGSFFARVIPKLPRKVYEISLGRMYGDPARVAKGTIDGYTIGLNRVSVEHVMGIVRGWYDDMAALAQVLGKVAEKPALLIWGDRDRAVGIGSAGQLCAALPQARLLVLPGVGHVAFSEVPEICNAAVSEWLRDGSVAEVAAPVVGLSYVGVQRVGSGSWSSSTGSI